MQLVTDLTKELKASLESLYVTHERIDLAIESLLEGRRGGNLKLWVDDLTNPELSAIAHGSFVRFAGEPEDGHAASGFINGLKTPLFVQPSPARWIQLLEETYGEMLQQTRRYRLSSNQLRKSHLVEILRASPWADSIQRLEKQQAKRLSEDAWGQYHFPNCAEPQELVEKGMAFCIHADDEIASCCSSILTSRRGYEVNIITKPAYRRQGMAMAVAARFILECLEKNLEPHWDGANEASQNLAIGLGYTGAGTYSIYYVN